MKKSKTYYNLSPLLSLSRQYAWEENITAFFSNENYDPRLRDRYYNILIDNYVDFRNLMERGYLIDPYTGLFTFHTEETDGASATFNLARFFSLYYQSFKDKRILILTSDYAVCAVQARLCGLNVVNVLQNETLLTGTVLTCLGNRVAPYELNVPNITDFDVLICASVFHPESLAWTNWNFMLDSASHGKQVFFTSNTFKHLRSYIRYDILERINMPEVDAETYSDMRLGYGNKVYRINL